MQMDLTKADQLVVSSVVLKVYQKADSTAVWLGCLMVERKAEKLAD